MFSHAASVAAAGTSRALPDFTPCLPEALVSQSRPPCLAFYQTQAPSRSPERPAALAPAAMQPGMCAPTAVVPLVLVSGPRAAFQQMQGVPPLQARHAFATRADFGRSHRFSLAAQQPAASGKDPASAPEP
ncbi:hypothetical protein ABPG77_010127 [Micractinium sp. CCAP 211/92]